MASPTNLGRAFFRKLSFSTVILLLTTLFFVTFFLWNTPMGCGDSSVISMRETSDPKISSIKNNDMEELQKSHLVDVTDTLHTLFYEKVDPDNNIKGSVGVLLYAINEKGTFILLGKESEGKSGEGTWCELGGSMEKGETFLEGAIREANEESGGAYLLSPEYVESNCSGYFSNKKENSNGEIRIERYFLIKTPVFCAINDLMKAVNKDDNPCFREKNDFKWVQISSLITLEEGGACVKDENKEKSNDSGLAKNKKGYLCMVQDIAGERSPILLRNFFYAALQQPDFKKALIKVRDEGRLNNN